MEKLRALWADAQAWLSAATPRERRLLALAASGVLLFVVLVSWASFSSAIRRAQASLDEKRSDFDKSRAWRAATTRSSASDSSWKRACARARRP